MSAPLPLRGPVMSGHTPGPWSFACDSYGKVRHSRKACVYRGDGSVKEPLVTVAARIPNWADARLIAAAPELHQLTREALAQFDSDQHIDIRDWVKTARALLARIEGDR